MKMDQISEAKYEQRGTVNISRLASRRKRETTNEQHAPLKSNDNNTKSDSKRGLRHPMITGPHKPNIALLGLLSIRQSLSCVLCPSLQCSSYCGLSEDPRVNARVYENATACSVLYGDKIVSAIQVLC